MNRILTYCFAGLLSIGISSNSLALTITVDNTDINVGDVDSFLVAEDLPNSGDTTEADWINSVLETDIVLDVKTEDLLAISTVEDADIITVALQTDDLYFILKNSTYTALFENTDNFDWAVIDTSMEITVTEADGTLSTGIFSDFFNLSSANLEISHITTTTSVPEPSTLALMGLGLMVIGFSRLRRLIKQ